MEDHYTINVAKRIRPDTAPYGPYHDHYFKVVLSGSTTKQEALDVLADLQSKYPEPDHSVEMTHWVCRGYGVGRKVPK